MSDSQLIVVDTNILFSALLRADSSFAQTLVASGQTFYICESTIVELFRHKEKIVQLSQLSEDEVVRFFYILLRRVTVVKEELIEASLRQQAYDLCSDIDEADTPHVALTLHLQGLLWTGDKTLKEGLRRKGFESFFNAP